MDWDAGKIFVGGISWETTEDKLRDYFSNYGQVTEAVIIKDRATGRGRGFGFIVFADPLVAGRVAVQKHTIDGRTVEAKKAVPRYEQQTVPRSLGGGPAPAGMIRTKKIFVGGLASTVNEEDFKRYFGQFGNIIDVVVMYDHATQRPRGFGFITFDTEDAVDNVLQKSFHELKGKLVEVKRAIPKELQPPAWARSPRAGSMPRSSPFAGSYGDRYGDGPAGRGGYLTYGGNTYGSAGYASGGRPGPVMNGSYGEAFGYGSAAEASHGAFHFGGTAGGDFAAGYGPIGSAWRGSFGSISARNTWGTGGYGSLGSSAAAYDSAGSGYGIAGGWSSRSGSTRSYGAAGYGYKGSESDYTPAAEIYGGGGAGYVNGSGSYGGQSGATSRGSYGAGYGDEYTVSGYEDSIWRSGSAEDYFSAPGRASLGSEARHTGAVPAAANLSGAGYSGEHADSGKHVRRPNSQFNRYNDQNDY